MRRRHPTHSDAASSRDFFGLKKFRSRHYYASVVQRLVFRSSKPEMGCRDPSLAPYGGLTCTAASTVLKTVGAGDRMGIDTSALRHPSLALWTNWQSYQAFNLEFAGSYPARVTIIWRISSEEQNASLSRQRSRVQVPYTSPPIQSLASY